VAKPIKLADLIENAYQEIEPGGPPFGVRQARGSRTYSQYHNLMQAGDTLRKSMSNDIVARLAIMDINSRRHNDVDSLRLIGNEENRPRGVAYIITSILHPDEVKMLRTTYESVSF